MSVQRNGECDLHKLVECIAILHLSYLRTVVKRIVRPLSRGHGQIICISCARLQSFTHGHISQEGLKLLGQLQAAGLEGHAKKPCQAMTLSLKRLKVSMNNFNDLFEQLHSVILLS